MIQYADHILDGLIAPEYSKLTSCLAPDRLELLNYFGSFFLNNIFLTESQNKARPVIIVFLRRLTQAVREYQSGRQILLSHIMSDKMDSTFTLYVRSLSHFEYSIINSYLALLAHDAVARILVPNAGRSYSRGDGSPAERLGILYNTLKHFDERVIEGDIGDVSAPVWLVNDGIKCAHKEKNGKCTTMLQFDELVRLLDELEEDARFLSEDVYRIAAERRSTRTPQGDTNAL